MNHDESLDNDKENAVSLPDVHKTPLHSKTRSVPSLSQRSATRDVRDCPQTPVGRLPLTELLANNEENRQQPSGTPVERVMWESASLSSSLTSTKPSQKRKRATSHSPPSSSEKRHSTMLNALKTPRMEPADDLWNRLTLHTTERRSPSAIDGPNFANFLQSSSPQTPATNASRDSKLRRTLSCIDWPTSTAKRRKLYHDNDARKSATKFVDSAEKSKLNRVSVLVDQMHSGLAKSRRSPPAYSSSEPAKSSPTRARNDSPERRRISSPQPHDIEVADVVTSMSQTVVNERVAEPTRQPAQTPHVGHSFDFDEDMNDELIDAADAEENLVSESCDWIADHVELSSQSTQRKENGATYAQPSLDNSNKCAGVPAVNHIVQNDEFEDDIGEEFAADLEEVYSRYESQQPVATSMPGRDLTRLDHASAHQVESGHAQKPIINILSDDEDFGNDSDFEQLAAECADATQNAAGSQLHVMPQPFRTAFKAD